MTGKIPKFGAELANGIVQTSEAVQTGCCYCLFENIKAPADNHVAYVWAGTSMCANHFKTHVIDRATNA
jgi:hypothetical protein